MTTRELQDLLAVAEKEKKEDGLWIAEYLSSFNPKTCIYLVQEIMRLRRENEKYSHMPGITNDDHGPGDPDA